MFGCLGLGLEPALAGGDSRINAYRGGWSSTDEWDVADLGLWVTGRTGNVGAAGN